MKRSDLLIESKRKRRLVTIFTKHPEEDDDEIRGIVVDLKLDFVAIAEEARFQPDGLVFLPKKHVKSVRLSPKEECIAMILKSNGQLGRLRRPRWISKIANLRELLVELKRKDIWPGIEAIYRQGKDRRTGYYIGPIQEVGEADFRILCFDAAGRQEKSYRLKQNAIFQVMVDAAYVRRFVEFIKDETNGVGLQDNHKS